MNDKNASGPGSNRRTSDRFGLSRKMLLELDSGDILVSRSRDISLRGVLLDTEERFEGAAAGDAATLYVFGDDGKQSSGFRCRVVRVTEACVALELDRKVVASFGQYMTKDLFGR